MPRSSCVDESTAGSACSLLSAVVTPFLFLLPFDFFLIELLVLPGLLFALFHDYRFSELFRITSELVLQGPHLIVHALNSQCRFLVFVESCVDLLEVLLSIEDSALILVALSSVDQFVDDFLKCVHILKLVVNDAVLDEFFSHLRLLQPNFVVHVTLFLQLIFLTNELPLHDFEHLFVESPFDFKFARISFRVHKLSSHRFTNYRDIVRNSIPMVSDFLPDHLNVWLQFCFVFDAII